MTLPSVPSNVKHLRRGVNIGDALEAPQEGEWGVTVQENYFDRIQDAGFDFVRLPLRWNAHAEVDAPYTVAPDFFARVDQIVDWACQRHLSLILDFHHYLEMMSDPQGHCERFQSIWRQVAEHYKEYPNSVLFELLNEPNASLDAVQWNTILAQALAVVRESNPTRSVVVGPVNWNAFDQLVHLHVPESDRRLIVTFHYYLPFHFTHQGAGWVDGSHAWLGTGWAGTGVEKQAIIDDFDEVTAWAQAHQRPILLGEFGAYSKADMPSRARWTTFVARQAEAHHFAWAYWEFCSRFGVYDPQARRYRPALLPALVP